MLTNKKRLYAEARISGKNQTDSAIYAGCPEATASQAASRYEKDPDVIAYRDRLTKAKPKIKEVFKKTETTVEPGECPLAYMRRVMSNETEDPKLRLEAAKALASYTFPKPGETGKKDQRQKDAEATASGRFGLRAVS